MVLALNDNELLKVFSGEKTTNRYEFLQELEQTRASYGELSKLIHALEDSMDSINKDEYLSTLYILALIKHAEDAGGLDGKAPAHKAKEHIDYMIDTFGTTSNALLLQGLWHRDIHKIAHEEIDREKSAAFLQAAVEVANTPENNLELAKALIKIGRKQEAKPIVDQIVDNAMGNAHFGIRQEAEKWQTHISQNTSIEIRIPNLKFLERALRYECSIISMGSDSCPYCLPSIDDIDEAYDKVAKAGREFKLVTPVIFQKHWSMFLEYLDQVVKKFPNLRLVINDYGVLNYLNGIGYDMKNVSVGHVLSYIYEECPWFSYLLDGEGDFLKNSEEITVFDTPGNLSVLKEFGIGEVETCLMPFAITSFYGFWKTGFKVNAMVDMIPFTYGRACHGARYYEKTVGNDCFEVCDRITKLRYSHRWIFQEKHMEKIKDDTYDRISIMHSYGNVIYSKTNYIGTVEDINKTDAITIDIRHYTDEQLDALISNYIPLTQAV